MDKRKSLILISWVSILFLIIQTIAYPYFYVMGVKNVFFYGFICFTLLIGYYISNALLNEKNTECIGSLACFVIGVGFVLWGIFTYKCELDDPYFLASYSVRHQIPMMLFMGAGVVISTLLYIALLKSKKEINVLRIVVSCLCLGLQGAMLYAPCIISDKGGSLYHIHAYFNPIYNTSKLLPFDDIIKSIYGHYSVFYFLPVKLMSLLGLSEVRAVIILQCIIGAVSFGLIYYTLGKLIKNDILFYLSVAAISYISFSTYSSGQYYQLLPHRIIFPALTLFFAYRLCNGKAKEFWGLIIAVSSMIWNFETGLVCTLVIVCVCIACGIVKNEKIKIAALILKYFGLGIASFILSILVLSLINVILGGGMISFKDFIFPLMSDDFKVDELELKLPGIFSMFYFEVILFIGTACAFLPKVFRRCARTDDIIILACSALGLGLMPYYTNRAATNNISITHIPLVLLLTLLVNKTFKSQGDDRTQRTSNVIIRIICVTMLSFLALDAVISIPFAAKMRAESTWNVGLYKEFLEYFEQEIPKDTVAVGPGLPDIYSDLGWDPGICIMDWADSENSTAIATYAKKQISEAGSIIISKDFVGAYINDEEWLRLKDIGGSYYYCIKRPADAYDVVEAAARYADEVGLSDMDFLNVVELNCYGYCLEEERNSMLCDLLSDGANRLELGYILYQDSMEMEYEQ